MNRKYWTANDLRALAEEMDSYRNEKMCLVPDLVGSTGLKAVLETTANDEQMEVVLHFYTTDEDEKNSPREDIKLTSDKAVKKGANSATTDLSEYDAIFTSLSAVDKFVIPYYVSMLSLADCNDKRKKFADNPNAVAVLHTPKSVSSPGIVDDRSFFIAVVDQRGEYELTPF